jgi:NifU-like protein
MIEVEKSIYMTFSQKVVKSLQFPLYAGKIESCKEGKRLVIGEDGLYHDGNFIRFYLVVNEADGVIHEAKFQAFGETLLIAAGEILCELSIEKNYAQAKRISAELAFKSFEDKALKKGLPKEAALYVNLAIDALDMALSQCDGLPAPEEFLVTPLDLSDLKKGDYPNWPGLSHQEKTQIIKEILAVEIAPYVELDDGGVVLEELKGDFSVVIKYSGNCTTCISSTGSTLSAIQQILRARVHPLIEVIPLL